MAKQNQKSRKQRGGDLWESFTSLFGKDAPVPAAVEEKVVPVAVGGKKHKKSSKKSRAKKHKKSVKR